MLDAYAAAVDFAANRMRSREKARDVVHDAWEKTRTTRRWDSRRCSFETHLVGVVQSLLSHEHESPARRNQALAAEGFHREVIGHRTESAEEDLLEREYWAPRDSGSRTLYEKLALALARHPVAPAVLRCLLDGNLKAADIAEQLGMPVEKVYRANEVIKDNLRRIREADHV
jgi:DNA-directed RNA polymerase specialized sigma24 family protein